MYLVGLARVCSQADMGNRHMGKVFLPLILLMGAAISGCGKPDPLANLSPDDRAFLFADSETHAPFLGQAVDNGPLNCYPQRMNQGYVLVDTDKDLFLDSIRPSGVERHKVLGVTTTEKGFIVKGQNGVSVPFNLIIERQGTDRAWISWDGARPDLFRRCEKAGE
jgi:hypothetical protein